MKWKIHEAKAETILLAIILLKERKNKIKSTNVQYLYKKLRVSESIKSRNMRIKRMKFIQAKDTYIHHVRLVSSPIS
jgi:hypothetical protein